MIYIVKRILFEIMEQFYFYRLLIFEDEKFFFWKMMDRKIRYKMLLIRQKKGEWIKRIERI